MIARVGAARSQDNACNTHYGVAGETLSKLTIWPLADGRLDEFRLANDKRLMAS